MTEDLDEVTRARALHHVMEALSQLERLRTILAPEDQRQRSVTEVLTAVWVLHMLIEPRIFGRCLGGGTIGGPAPGN